MNLFVHVLHIIVTKVINLVNVLCESNICEGNMDEEFLKLPNIQKNVLMNHSSELHMDVTGCVYPH